ncbi:response regulator [Nocardioides anomalus]|uniref:Circadian input-output histidine kinase CikA n=1 Tax=Nocardioides anomalus TaxID=2712223 RepID=A0A6G6WD41_9ACTN|nr:response regulator [Nocardioides anomalus]QIG42960.1 response regulator [Nocardioides anomalus]
MELSELYRDIVETSPDGIWVIDLEGRTLFANPEIARIHRIPLEDAARLTVFDTLDEPGQEQFRAHLRDVRSGRVNQAEVEVHWVRSDGEPVWMLCRESALLDRDGEAWALLHRYTDHTTQHELVASLRASEDALADQVAQNNLMQAVASAANEAETLRDVLLQARHMVLLHDDWERARAFVPAADGSGRVEPFYAVEGDAEADREDPFAATELELAQQSHDRRAAVWDERRLTIAFPVVLDEDVYAVIAITSAPPLWRFELIESMAGRVAEQLARVAWRERAQRELSQARDAAEEASRQKSEFLATMSHEIRTPLNGVIGLNDLLLRTALSLEQQRLSTGVQVASRALLGLINDILDFSKIEAGRMELEHLDFEIRPLLEQVAGILNEAARDKGLDLVVSCHPDVPAVLGGDPTRLAQVVTNLVSNAVKFTERGGVIVRATTAPVEAEAESGEPDGPPREQVQLQVSVGDTGVGVPQTKVEDLFDPFTQADSSTTRIYGGTGLGLAISREIVEAMGGSLSYAPNFGGGSIFTATFVLDVGNQDGAGDPSGSTADAHARRALAGRRALVVDDNETNRIIAREQLAWWGVESDEAPSVDEGLARLGSATYDVVLLDLAMPQQDGLDLARQVRADHANDDLRLLMLTSVTTLPPEQLREAGVDEVLAKPVLSSVLRSTLLRLLVDEPRPEAVSEPEPVRTQTKGHVLVVEDNAVNQMVATGLLGALGYTTETADDGLAAIEATQARDFDLILMDVQMPRMDGYTATRHIREAEDGARRPIIAMTAAAVEGERERCLEAGMDDFLTKPVDPKRLAETLERWLSRPAYAERLEIARLSELRELDDGVGPSYIDRAIGNFLRSAVSDAEALTAAVSEGDPTAVRSFAHRMAGAALNLGAQALGTTAREVEERAVAGDVAGAAALLPRLGADLEADLEALRAYQREQFPLRAL